MAPPTDRRQHYLLPVVVDPGDQSDEPIEPRHDHVDETGPPEVFSHRRHSLTVLEPFPGTIDISYRTPSATLVIELKHTVDTGQHLLRLADTLGISADDILRALEAVMAASPPGSDDPTHHLSYGEVEALQRSGALKVAMPEPAERASTQTAARTALLEAAALTVKEVAAMLDRSEMRVRQRLTEHTLLGTRAGRTWRVPAFQFHDGSELPGWDKVMAAFPDDVHPLTVKRFLDSESSNLDADGNATTPRQWLASGGDVHTVVELAAELHQIP
jgi:hypothetical protein